MWLLGLLFVSLVLLNASHPSSNIWVLFQLFLNKTSSLEKTVIYSYNHTEEVYLLLLRMFLFLNHFNRDKAFKPKE